MPSQKGVVNVLIVNLKDYRYLGYSDIGCHIVSDITNNQISTFQFGKLIVGSAVFFAKVGGSISPTYSTVRKASRDPQFREEIMQTKSELSRKRVKSVEELLRDFYLQKEA